LSAAVPQAAPGEAVAARRSEYLAAAERVLDSGSYILSGEVEAFESEFAAFVGANHALGVASGTDAIEIALRAVGIGAGDGVVTVSHTAGATVAAILRIGAVAVLVDVDEATFAMDPAAVEHIVASPPAGVRLRALLPVHLYGALADMPRLCDIAAAASLRVVEDCAQAHGATLDGVAAGAWGDAAAFSFYPTKNLAAIGDGGAVVSNDPAVIDAARPLREYGWRRRQFSEGPGFNSRLDELQAAFLRVGLRHLAEDNSRRARIASMYDEGLAQSALVTPSSRNGHVFHQYVVRTTHRESFRAFCLERGVGTAVHYPEPIHRQPGFETAIQFGDLKATERLAREIVSLPMYPQLTNVQVQRVVDVAAAWRPGG
jgi:dTDP-4-amino-4,6-dideoxygalactose transaminase